MTTQQLYNETKRKQHQRSRIDQLLYAYTTQVHRPRGAERPGKISNMMPSERRFQMANAKGDQSQRDAWLQSQLLADTDTSLPPGIRYHSPMEGTLEHPNNVNTCCEGQGTRLFGSLPEYIYSLSTNTSQANGTTPSGFYVNMFAASQISFTASAEALVAPTLAPPAPPAVVKPTPPSPQMTFELVSPPGGGYYNGVFLSGFHGDGDGDDIFS